VRPLNAATALSLLLCAATVALWLRSYRRIDIANHASARLHRAISVNGGVCLDSLTLVNVTNSWRDGSVTPIRTTEPYQESPTTKVVSIQNTPLVSKGIFAPAPPSIKPQVSSIEIPQSRTFDNVTGSLVTYSLVGRRVWIPYWIIAAPTAALPASRIAARLRRSRRARLNSCPTCGYDLRATPDRCPECGAIPDRRAAQPDHPRPVH